jgi:hypothetical protein
VRKAVMILLALLAIRLLPRALRQQARALELITLLFQLTAAAAANTSKTASTTARTASLETRVGDLEQGKFANLQGSSIIGQMQAGNFPQITTTGNITAGNNLGVNGGTVFWPGGVGISTSKAAFLASLSQCGPQADAGGNDGNTGPSWATGERGYINNAINAINGVRGALINHGFMAP